MNLGSALGFGARRVGSENEVIVRIHGRRFETNEQVTNIFREAGILESSVVTSIMAAMILAILGAFRYAHLSEGINAASSQVILRSVRVSTGATQVRTRL